MREITTRICGDCGKEKKLKYFPFRKNYNNTNKIYYNSVCKECMKARVYAWRDKNREKFKDYHREYYKNVRSPFLSH